MIKNKLTRATIYLICLIGGLGWQVVLSAEKDTARNPVPYIFADKARPSPAFDHTRHEEAFDNGGCARCHHVMDTATGQLAYVEDEEAACHECHAAQAVADTPGLREAAHESCTGCHRRMIKAGQKTGPTTCGQCHSQ